MTLTDDGPVVADADPSIAVAHVIPSFRERDGGVARVVFDLCSSLADLRGVVPTVVSRRGGAGDDAIMRSDAFRIVAPEAGPSWRRWFGSDVLGGLAAMSARAGLVVHNHGIWTAANHAASTYCRRRGIPMIAQPHGMLEPWSLAEKALKKRLALQVYQNRDLRSAAMLAATSEQEYEHLRSLGLRNPIAILPNGIRLHGDSGDRGEPAGPASTRTALFLSRIHHKKGLLDLLSAWARLRPPGWELKIAGPDDGQLQRVRRAIRDRDLAGCVHYVGAVYGDEKSKLYDDSDLFVLPTHSENFGLVVAEALDHGLPVITTTAAPWGEIAEHDCGWWIEPGERPLLRALQSATRTGDEQLRAMGARGREFVKRFEWSAIAARAAASYRWALGMAERPDCVRLD